MNHLEQQLENYIKEKIAKLEKIRKLTYFLNTILRFGVMLLNLVIIALAFTVIVMEVNRYETELKAPGQEFDVLEFLSVAGLTVVLATFIVMTFVTNLVLSFYSAVMKFNDYKHALREIEYITLKLEQDSKNYSIAEFDADFAEIRKIYLARKTISKKEIFIRFIMGGK